MLLLLHGVLLLHRVLLAHRVLAHRTLTHRTLTHGALTHGALAHRTGTVLLLGARPGRQLQCAGLLLRLPHLLGRTHLLLGHRLRTGYGSGHRTVLLFRLAHALLLVLGSGTSGCGQLGPQILVLAEQSSQLRLYLVEEGVDLILVIALSEADGRELLVPNVLGGQRHLFTST
jgi:hypothetical protein